MYMYATPLFSLLTVRSIQASINTNGGSEGWYDPDPYCVRFDLSRDMTDAEVDKLPKLVYGNRDVKAQHLAGRALADSGLLGVLMETPELAKPEGLKLTITNLYTLVSVVYQYACVLDRVQRQCMYWPISARTALAVEADMHAQDRRRKQVLIGSAIT